MDRVKPNCLDGAANLVVEVVSPDGRKRDWVEKLAEYEQMGVNEYWIIDPSQNRAEFRHLGEDGRYRLIPVDSEGVLRSEELPGVWLKVDWFWQEELPKLMDVLRLWNLI